MFSFVCELLKLFHGLSKTTLMLCPSIAFSGVGSHAFFLCSCLALEMTVPRSYRELVESVEI